MGTEFLTLFRSKPVAIEAPQAPALRLTPASEAAVEAVTEATNGRKKPRTQTRQYVNALIQQDWEDINARLDKAILEARELLEARSDIEMLAKFSGIELL